METLLTVSDGAAALPPSKMGFKPGTQIRLDNALKIMMVKSANDVAATIAENIGGSIDGFAELMNAHAQPPRHGEQPLRQSARPARRAQPDLGPRHGDPRPRAAAGIPRPAATCSTSAPIQFGRRIMRNTNGLIGRYPGADGMKTGFICSSGFNVVASATRNGRHLITVVLGAPSANERTMKAAELFDRGFSSKVNFTNPELAALPASANASSAGHALGHLRPARPDAAGRGQPRPLPKTDSGVPNLFSSEVMAFAGAAADKPLRTVLGPRAAVQPERVWIGLNPPSEAEIAAQAAGRGCRRAGPQGQDQEGDRTEEGQGTCKDTEAKRLGR